MPISQKTSIITLPLSRATASKPSYAMNDGLQFHIRLFRISLD